MKVIQFRNARIEEGRIYVFTECGHRVSISGMADKRGWTVPETTLYCPLCGIAHQFDISILKENPRLDSCYIEKNEDFGVV